jgi:hypothetical protein
LAGITGPTVIYFVQRSYRKSDLIELEELKFEIKKDQDTFLHKSKLCSESQFKLYDELWRKLTELEVLVENLWDKDFSNQKIKEFIRVVGQTDQKVRESALIIAADDYESLVKIIETLKEYHVGKRRLLELKDIDERASQEIQAQIETNFELRSDYVDLKKEILRKMREQIGAA